MISNLWINYAAYFVLYRFFIMLKILYFIDVLAVNDRIHVNPRIYRLIIIVIASALNVFIKFESYYHSINSS